MNRVPITWKNGRKKYSTYSMRTALFALLTSASASVFRKRPFERICGLSKAEDFSGEPMAARSYRTPILANFRLKTLLRRPKTKNAASVTLRRKWCATATRSFFNREQQRAACYALSKGRKNLTVLTNDLSHAILAEELLVDSEVILLGGQLRFGYHYTQGNETIRLLNEYFVPTAFMGTNTFSFSKGFMAHRLEQANMVSAIANAADRRITLMDSSKIGVIGLVHALDLNEINCLITDTGVDADTRQRLAELAPNLEIIYA